MSRVQGHVAGSDPGIGAEPSCVLDRAERAITMPESEIQTTVVKANARHQQVLNAITVDVSHRQDVSEPFGDELALQEERSESVVEEDVAGIREAGVIDIIEDLDGQIGGGIARDEVPRGQAGDPRSIGRSNGGT